MAATDRKLTAAERALAERYLAFQASSARLGARLVLPLALAVTGLGFWIANESVGAALALWVLGAGLLAFVFFVARQVRFRVEDRARRLRGVCSSQLVPRLGKFFLLGGSRVTLLPGWESFWRDGAEVEVDVCYLLRPNANQPAVVLLLSLPPLSAELAAQQSPLASRGNGWLALNAITLALAFLASLWLLSADSEEVLGTALYLNAPKHFASISELLQQAEAPTGVEIEIEKAYRVALDAESYLVELHEDERKDFVPLALPSSDDSVSASAQAEAQARFNRELERLKERVLAKPHESVLEKAEGYLPGSVRPVANVHGILRKSPAPLAFVTDARSDAPAIWIRFLLAISAFAVTLVFAARRQRAADRALLDWQTRVLAQQAVTTSADSTCAPAKSS